MPPRATKKSNPLAVQTASRQGRNTGTQIADDMNVVDDENQTDCMEVDDEVENNTPDPSQGTAVRHVILQGYNNQKKRHNASKKRLKDEYNQEKTELQDSITALFDEHEKEADNAHRARLTRLADLLAQKAALESQMTTKLAYLKAAYDTHSKELETVVCCRIKEMK